MNKNGHYRRHFEFADFRLYPHERLLIKNDNRVALTPRVLDLLILLVERYGELVGKETLLDVVWADSFVDEGNISRAVSTLRKNLGVQSNGSDFIETVPKLGYRFIAPVHQITEDPQRAVLPVKPAPTRRPILLAAAGLSVLLIVSLGSYLWFRGPKSIQKASGAVRLTDDPADDFWPKWTKDGRIRFYRMGSDKKGKNMLMNADGTDQTEGEPGHWSPDGTKVIVSKPGDKAAMYLRNADGSNEITLPPLGNTDWSADSKKIVYQFRVGEEKNSELFIYSLETGKTENVTNHPGFDADPSFSMDGKQIVFVSGRDGNSEVYLMNVDGSNVRRLTNHPAYEVHPVFSPDGTQIAFSSDRENENSNVFLMRPDGSEVRRLTDWPSNETVEPGCWSPDGARIALFSDIHGNDDIFVMSAEAYHPEPVLAEDASNLQRPSYSPNDKQIVYQAEMPDKTGELRIFDTETKQNRVLLKTKNADLAPVFSPDGTRIAFQNKIESNTEICLINPDGSGMTNLTNNPWRDGGAAFSPDGTQIVFSSNRDGNTGKFNLYLMSLDGGDQRLIYSAKNGMSGTAVFSPDGTSILFSNDFATDGNFEIFKIRPETSETAERLTFRNRYDGNPAFSPDGKLIAFASNTDGNAEIYLMDADGKNLLRLTRNEADDTLPQFSRDGKRIIFSSNRGGKYALYEMEIAE